MQTEYEATFYPVVIDEVRSRLQTIGATPSYPARLMRRSVFNLPNHSPQRWARVRDEGDRITMSVKDVSGGAIESQKEAMVTIDSFEQGVALLTALGCQEKAYQETRRELWMMDGVEVTIDEWPFLEPFVEVEGVSEESVRAVAEKLGFGWNEARFCAVDALYAERYSVSEEQINNKTPRIVFGEQNPFLS